jgi:hypothetical protein
MKTTDKMLIGIVVAILLLIVAALAITLTRPEPTYGAEDTPEGVTHNYLLALQREEFERAFGYLSPTLKGYPATVERFVDDIHDNPWSFRLDTDTTLMVGAASITGNNATVRVRESRFEGGDLFGSGQSTLDIEMQLHREDGVWKIVNAFDYFAMCWNEAKGCQ